MLDATCATSAAGIATCVTAFAATTIAAGATSGPLVVYLATQAALRVAHAVNQELLMRR